MARRSVFSDKSHRHAAINLNKFLAGGLAGGITTYITAAGEIPPLALLVALASLGTLYVYALTEYREKQAEQASKEALIRRIIAEEIARRR